MTVLRMGSKRFICGKESFYGFVPLCRFVREEGGGSSGG